MRADARGIDLACYDRLYALALALYGKAKAYPWLVKATSRAWLAAMKDPDGAVEALHKLFPNTNKGAKDLTKKQWLDSVDLLDAPRIARAIEYTRFPYAPSPSNGDDLNEEEGLLLRAADLIGQLGDPNYMRKSNALFYEFEETGLNKTLGYNTPADIVYKYPQFYWTNVAPQIQTAIRYLNVTSSGRQWIERCGRVSGRSSLSARISNGALKIPAMAETTPYSERRQAICGPKA